MSLDLIQLAATELGRATPIIGFLWFYLREMREDVTGKIGQLTDDVNSLKISVASQNIDLKLQYHREMIDDIKADLAALKLKHKGV